MKTVWIALMAVCMGGWIGLLLAGLESYYEYGCNIRAIVLWVLSVIVIGIGVFGFLQASKIGKREDEIEA